MNSVNVFKNMLMYQKKLLLHLKTPMSLMPIYYVYRTVAWKIVTVNSPTVKYYLLCLVAI
jgi:hypothetical protein